MKPGRSMVPRPLVRHVAVSLALATGLGLVQASRLSAQTANPPPSAWRVECAGDGKSLECRAIQQIFRRDAQQQLVPLVSVAVRYLPESKGPGMSILLPLGLNLTEPVAIRVDGGATEHQPIQTCNNAGCLVTFTPSEKLMSALRNGTDLKLTVQDAEKKPIELSLPLLGFGLAYDKTK